ncbi:hypothetical protein F383_28769 [Gossypium arboreum]|uniref:Uncharacterized protein n=1 Tax=Gossypium arboreum TaxID=29729 RepID=A0A0B0PGJ8_GOSAR|nr:hypothetical protein F383_28769 [Gossypium arboreum]
MKNVEFRFWLYKGLQVRLLHDLANGLAHGLVAWPCDPSQ